MRGNFLDEIKQTKILSNTNIELLDKTIKLKNCKTNNSILILHRNNLIRRQVI